MQEPIEVKLNNAGHEAERIIDESLMTGNKKPNNVHMHGTFHKFYLLKPKHTAKIKDVADSIMGLKDVQELYLTEGDYGFMLKTRFSDNKKPDEVEKYLAKNLDQKFGAVRRNLPTTQTTNAR